MIYAWVKWNKSRLEMPRHKQYILKFDTEIQSEVEHVMCLMNLSGRYFLFMDFRANDPLGIPVITVSTKVSSVVNEMAIASGEGEWTSVFDKPAPKYVVLEVITECGDFERLFFWSQRWWRDTNPKTEFCHPVHYWRRQQKGKT
jgi:hypothetical protein